MANETLNGQDLGNVTSESTTKKADLMIMAMPVSDSDNTLVFDFMGVERGISVTGNFVGTLATQQTKMAAIEGLIDGDQAVVVYVSEVHGSKNVYIKSTRFWKAIDADGTLKINYTIELVESAP